MRWPYTKHRGAVSATRTAGPPPLAARGVLTRAAASACVAYPGCDAYITYSSTSPYYKSVQPIYNPAGYSNTPLYYSNTANPANPDAQGACCGAATDANGNVRAPAPACMPLRNRCLTYCWR